MQPNDKPAHDDAEREAALMLQLQGVEPVEPRYFTWGNKESGMADDRCVVHDTRLAAIDRVLVQAGRVVHHWDEFGPGSDFEQEIVILGAALKQWNRFWGLEIHDAT